jgi:hypothetical protein
MPGWTAARKLRRAGRRDDKADVLRLGGGRGATDRDSDPIPPFAIA